MGRDENTPIWTQHLALKVDGEETLNATKHKLIDAGLEVLGPVNHTLFKSIYFFDPNGHRVELACDIATDHQYRKVEDMQSQDCLLIKHNAIRLCQEHTNGQRWFGLFKSC
ncbi:Fumarylacetoacetate hydrolase family protein [Moraxella catarrhalis]|nr:Fumarylacetoacetate hydrolase family protein [Moraxella catarrhalis]